MATLERTRRRADALDVLDVPTPFENYAVASPQVETELIELGQERLFSGSRRQWNHEDSSRDNIVAGPSRLDDAVEKVPVVSELYDSLTSARQAFLFALYDLLHQTLSESGVTSQARPSLRASLTPQINEERESSLSNDAAAPDLLLATLMNYLRSTPQSQLQSSDSNPTDVSPDRIGATTGGLMEEMTARVTNLSVELSSTDSELARSLASLLTYIERLLIICRPLIDQSTRRPTLTEGDESTSTNVYATLERDARALQSSNREQWSNEIVGAAREVELAERDLLWGRVDDLSERVGELCRIRATSVAESRAGVAGSSNPTLVMNSENVMASTEHAQSVISLVDLPRYSPDRLLPSPHLPPAYIFNSTEHRNSKLTSSDNMVPNNPHPDLRNHRSSEHSEKMQRDLDSVAEAIDRLYLVSPQMANQRVEPDRRKLRERQLTKLGNAIERLSQGRLNDQRAAPIVGEEAAKRVRLAKAVELDKLIDQINKAASRTFADQRVAISGKRQEFLRRESIKSGLAESATFYATDLREQERQKYIVNNTGKGRIESQDASFSVVPAAAPIAFTNPFQSPPARDLSFNEFFSQRDDNVSVVSPLPSSTSPSVGTSPIRKKLSSMFKNEDKSPSRLGVFRKVMTPSGSRRGSGDTQVEAFGSPSIDQGTLSRRASLIIDLKPLGQVDYLVESSPNLGLLTITFWLRNDATDPPSFDVLAINSLHVLVAPSTGGSTTRIVLPVAVIIDQSATITSHGSFYELKLTTFDSSSSSRCRIDTEIKAPLSTAELRLALPSSFVCSKCHTELIDSTSISKYNALPSEHWAELLDSWMCHGDQELSADLVAKGRGIRPREEEGLVGSSYLVFRREVSKNWSIMPGVEPARTDSDDLLTSVSCSTCHSFIGYHVTSLSPLPLPTYFRLIKYASHPVSLSNPLKRHSLSSHLTAELLEIGQAHACHRFVVEDTEIERVRILLWLFNPSVQLSFSNSTAMMSSFVAEESVDPCVRASMHAVKIFYSLVEDETDSNCQAFITSSDTTMERIQYPLSIIQDLSLALQASTSLIHPVDKRSFGSMSVGFLERM